MIGFLLGLAAGIVATIIAGVAVCYYWIYRFWGST